MSNQAHCAMCAETVHVLLERYRVHEAIYTWIRVQSAASLLTRNFVPRLLGRMRGAELNEEDIRNEAKRRLRQTADLLMKSTTCRDELLAKEMEKYKGELGRHECSGVCMRLIPNSPGVFVCVYLGHLHWCTDSQCSTLLEGEQGSRCRFTHMSTAAYEYDFEEDPEGTMKKQGTNVQPRSMGHTKKKSDAEKRWELDRSELYRHMLDHLRLRGLDGMQEAPNRGDVHRIPGDPLAPPASKRARSAASAFLVPAKTLQGLYHYEPSLQYKLDGKKRDQLFQTICDKWKQLPFKASVLMSDFAILVTCDELHLTPPSHDGRVMDWLHGTAAPSCAKKTAAIPAAHHDILPQAVWQFDQKGSGDGMDF